MGETCDVCAIQTGVLTECDSCHDEAIARAVLAEREACAKVALDGYPIPIEFWQGTKRELTAEIARRIAAAIRERGK